jgi:hypothetical protein
VKAVELSGKEGRYLKENFNKFETNSKNNNITGLYRGINEFREGYQPRTNTVKDDNSDMLADCCSILDR